MNDNKPPKPKISALPGIAAVGLLITGITGIQRAYYTGSGLGLIASAISFGCILIVMFL